MLSCTGPGLAVGWIEDAEALAVAVGGGADVDACVEGPGVAEVKGATDAGAADVVAVDVDAGAAV